MFAPTRPASASPTSTGASSIIIVLPTKAPTRYRGTAPVKLYDDRSARTIPVNAAMNAAIGSDCTPIRSIWTIVSPPHVRTSRTLRPTSARKCPMRPTAVSQPATRTVTV